MASRVQVLDNISGQILYECNVDQIDLAYKKAHEYEEMGLDIAIKAPGLTETLIKTLGANDEEISLYKMGLEDEISEHNNQFGDEFGCAICPTKTQK
jgi:hypothetical protein